MEEESSVKISVAELAGKFKSPPLPVPKTDERKPVQRSPPCFLQLHDQMENKLACTPQPPPKAKLKHSPLIDKLQASPILLPTILLNSAKSPEGKQQSAFCPNKPCSPQSPTLRPPQQHGDNEVPTSFEQPAEGTILPSFNKSRIRLSFKRRPPTRQHRKSAGEELVPDTPDDNRSLCDQHSGDNTPDKDDNTKDALNVSQEETHESQEDSTPPITVKDTELQEEHDDVTKHNEGIEDTEGENKEQVAEEKSSGNPEASEAVDNQKEEKALEEHSTAEMEGSKKEEETLRESTEKNMDEEDQDQDQASGD
ncbi:capZ-interacting protein isoform X2 [Tachysurus fulvidraco]|uniref:capZ-interacting protein isoform X2 n=1 Tax=Tachysurus fulvidraco TaxID=1234273 RepID=UPI000F4D4115|nr:capZ-interacting protein isoform X2 [Tachysurus fulvidraco]